MNDARHPHAFGRCIAGLLIGLALLPVPARAAALMPGLRPCHAVVPSFAPVERLLATRLACTGMPTDYRGRTLLLGIDMARLGFDPYDSVLLLHQSIFDRLTVLFRYDDGTVERRVVRRGDYGSRWRIGGQIMIGAPHARAALREIRLAFDDVASVNRLSIRVMQSGPANRDLALGAVLTSMALTLLLMGALYNLALAIAVRRQFLAWQGLWAGLVLAWGCLWSQIALIGWPGIAGTVTSQLSLVLSCLAVAAATMSAVTALRGAIRPWGPPVIAALGLLVPVVGVPAAFLSGPAFDRATDLLGFFELSDLVAIAVALAVAWRAGSREARDLSFAWAVPMTVLALATVFDVGSGPFGGGVQIVVLFASAFQTVWLSIASTRRLSRLRVELDAARAAETALAELANRDPLTGLLNRRGFVARMAAAFAGGNEASFGLLLIDIDLFKSINDRFGHESGDAVLCAIADRLLRLERELCITGRIGGEEFVLGVSGLTSYALEQFADRVRIDLGACDHGPVSRQRRVTVSIGVAEGSTTTPFQKLYGIADRALYDAKHAGRDRIVFHSEAGDREAREILARDQRSFDW